MNTLRTELLKQAKEGRIFIETGTADGEGVVCALEAGFDDIVTIEANEDVFFKACKRFAGYSNVKLCLGDSADVLPIILADIFEPVTFWLDAHWSTGEPETGANKCPLLKELAIIKRHATKGHTILIDDMRYYKKGIPQWHNINQNEIVDAILSISQNYLIEFKDGIVQDDILVATYQERANQD